MFGATRLLANPWIAAPGKRPAFFPAPGSGLLFMNPVCSLDSTLDLRVVRGVRRRSPETAFRLRRLIATRGPRDNIRLNPRRTGVHASRGQFSTSEETRAPEREPAPAQPVRPIAPSNVHQEGRPGNPDRRRASRRGRVPRSGSGHRSGGRPGAHSQEQGGPAQEAAERPHSLHRLIPRVAPSSPRNQHQVVAVDELGLVRIAQTVRDGAARSTHD